MRQANGILMDPATCTDAGGSGGDLQRALGLAHVNGHPCASDLRRDFVPLEGRGLCEYTAVGTDTRIYIANRVYNGGGNALSAIRDPASLNRVNIMFARAHGRDARDAIRHANNPVLLHSPGACPKVIHPLPPSYDTYPIFPLHHYQLPPTLQVIFIHRATRTTNS